MCENTFIPDCSIGTLSQQGTGCFQTSRVFFVQQFFSCTTKTNPFVHAQSVRVVSLPASVVGPLARPLLAAVAANEVAGTRNGLKWLLPVVAGTSELVLCSVEVLVAEVCVLPWAL